MKLKNKFKSRKLKKKIKVSKKKINGGRFTKTFKCHPKQDLNRVDSDTCLDRDSLKVLVREWNKRNATKMRISNMDDGKIMKQMIENLTQCKDDMCILDKIPDSNIKENMKKTIYAPEAPNSWKKNKNEWLTNIDINNVMKQYEEAYPNFKFLGVTPIDFDTKKSNTCVTPEICNFDISNYIDKTKINKFGIVFNTDPHTSGGSHWISMFIDLDRKTIFFFDSAGNEIPHEIKKLIKRIQKSYKNYYTDNYNKIQKLEYLTNGDFQHQKTNTECGMYCLYFLINLIKETRKLEDFKNELIRDDVVEQYRKIYFN